MAVAVQPTLLTPVLVIAIPPSLITTLALVAVYDPNWQAAEQKVLDRLLVTGRGDRRRGR